MVAAISTIGLWTSAFSHSSRRGYESLRPQTRRKWVIENALAIAFNIIFLQSVIICLNAFLIAAFLQGRISLPLILTALMSFVGGQVLSFGFFFWVASFNSRMWNVIAVAAMYGGLMSLSTEVLNPSPGGRQMLIALIACGTTSVTGIAFCGFAYRRWCRIDLE